MDDLSEYIESRNYFSWEQFFTDMLVEKSDGTYLKYKKSKLNEAYLQAHERNEILKNVPNSDIGK